MQRNEKLRREPLSSQIFSLFEQSISFECSLGTVPSQNCQSIIGTLVFDCILDIEEIYIVG